MNYEQVTVYAVMSEVNYATQIVGIFQDQREALSFIRSTGRGDWIEETTMYVAR